MQLCQSVTNYITVEMCHEIPGKVFDQWQLPTWAEKRVPVLIIKITQVEFIYHYIATLEDEDKNKFKNMVSGGNWLFST